MTATAYLGIYSFSNPDPKDCWVVRDLDVAATSKTEVEALAAEYNVKVTYDYPVEMGGVFRVWFLWGFYAKIILLGLLATATGLYTFWSKKSAFVMSVISFSLYFVNATVWFVLGCVWRFSKAGMTASGDELDRMAGVDDATWKAQVESARLANGYQISGGRFFKVYLMLAAWAISLTLIALITTAIVVTCKPMVGEVKYEALYEDEADANADEEKAEKNAQAEEDRQQRKKDERKRPRDGSDNKRDRKSSKPPQ